MIFKKNACQKDENLSKSTVLAMLSSNLDKTKAIILSTGEVINLLDEEGNSIYSAQQIQNLLNNKTLVYYENSLPRRLLLTNPNWTIVSFTPDDGNVCIMMESPSGKRQLSINLNSLTKKT